ncbi:hypothetical protein KUM39_24175 [Streptomyces sp. J2-1]|uniref:hypothetical protein n=1 Tax=Streptomyces corallincola TaxID=2851888 RepID=UPI001C38984B|nr:hypothetical protein [Streptomyces corallincola]MBV2357423.1 hypothetical protein [Streptomyces corallincola]
MREKPERGRRRIDLNVPQVAGSALAAVVAAKLAAYFGVYGTILGAGVVSVVATCGGTLFQHLFRHTGEQLREATSTPRPPRAGRAAGPAPAPGEFGAGTVYRSRTRSRRRPLLAAVLVFGVTMTGITVYETVSGSSFSGGTGTTVGDAVAGGTPRTTRPAPAYPSYGVARDGAGTPGDTASPSPTPRDTAPDPGPTGRPGTTRPATAPAPTATPTDGATPTTAPTTPAPSASSRSGTAVPDRGGRATP